MLALSPREGLVLAEKYQALHDAFDSWLCDCEAKAALPLQTEGDPLEIRRQLEELKVGLIHQHPNFSFLKLDKDHSWSFVTSFVACV